MGDVYSEHLQMCDYRNQKFINVFNDPFKELLLLLHATPELLMAHVLGTTNVYPRSLSHSLPPLDVESKRQKLRFKLLADKF